ncbi:hypothetical protein CRYUN_Cryun09bG0164100 [Craigia yunnanensis]
MEIVGDVEKTKTGCILAHDGMEEPIKEFETKVEENKADNKVKIKESVENLGAFPKERKLGKDAEGLSEEIDVDNIPRRALLVGPVSETVNDESQPSSSYSVHQEFSDSSELPVSTKVQELDDIRISAAHAIDTASNELLLNRNVNLIKIGSRIPNN